MIMKQLKINPNLDQVDPKLLESILRKANELAQDATSDLPKTKSVRYSAMPSYDGKSGIIFYEE